MTMNTMNTNSSTVRALTVVRATFAATLLVAGLGLTSVSQAADAGVQPAAKVVQFGDLNLSNKSAVEHLYRRIVTAAQLVCKDHAGPRLPEDQARTRICVDQSVERAVNQVNYPTLTALYAAKNGSSAPAVMASNR
jgi:UrcA family protein